MSPFRSAPPCNSFKADRTPAQVKFKMNKIPKAPTVMDIAWMTLFKVDIPEEWKDYLPEGSPWKNYWDGELASD